MFKSVLLYLACLGGATGMMRFIIFRRCSRVSSWGLGPSLGSFASRYWFVSSVPSRGSRGVVNAHSVRVLTVASHGPAAAHQFGRVRSQHWSGESRTRTRASR